MHFAALNVTEMYKCIHKTLQIEDQIKDSTHADLKKKDMIFLQTYCNVFS